ncbi:amidohydrolase family protein [Sphingorhabdus sp.]|uniref:amidohydrolase family protein n=1 Tax=Sphingorhabdus sp. TaxID=1902408 RepID=UPI00398312DF
MDRLKFAYAVGLNLANHSDFNVVPIDQTLVIWSAVNRIARSGVIIGPDEPVTPLHALKAVKVNGAYQFGEKASKESIVNGKLSNLLILSGNPLTVPSPDSRI